MKSSDSLCEVASRTRNYAINLDGKILRDSTPLACGTHALVYRGMLRPGGRIVAVKTVSPSNEKVIKEILREAHIASKMRHPNILPVFGITTDFDLTISLVAKWMEGGDAHQYVRQRDRDPRPLIRDIALGLHYLHTHPDGPIIHGNLKGYNVLVSAVGQATLADFGYSMFSNSSFTTAPESLFGGTLQWKAPELVDAESAENCRATEESDIWAFGMTALELFTAEVPHRNLAGRPAIAFRIIWKPPDRPSNKDTCARMTDEWWELISRCLRMEPSSRIRMPDIVEQIKQLKFPLRPTQCDITQLNQSNYNTSLDVPHQLAERASRYVFNLDGRIERGPSPCCRGGSTLIYRGKLLSDGRTVAIKTPRGVGMDDEGITKILKEAHTWSKLEHPNVLSILGITTRFDFTVSIVTLWMERGNANAYVQERDNDPRPLIKDIALGLRYLHSHPKGPIIHGDLKGENVLIASDSRAILTDFGLSILPNSSFSMSMTPQCGGSLRWMAPEVVDKLISEDPKPSVEGDIWAFGMTALELFTRKLPYYNLTNRDSIQSRIIKGPPEQPSSEDTCYRMTDEWWDLCSRCLRMDPSSRIGAEDVVKETRELPTRNDVVIVIMGPTGSGKSNFINKLTGYQGKPDANKPISRTEGIREFILDFSRDKRYVFVETPGFDNACHSDKEILRTIVDWLRDKYLKHVKITGVIYTHCIANDHMSDSVGDNLTEFYRLCAEKAAQHVRLVTTRWDEASDAETVPSLVSQMEGDLWKPLTAADARHERFFNTQKSALDIVNGLVGKEAQLIPEEVVDAEKQLNEISAMKAHHFWLKIPQVCKRIALFFSSAWEALQRMGLSDLGNQQTLHLPDDDT